MFREDNYEQIFNNKINKHNMDIIKKFFVFQPLQPTPAPIKPYTSLSSKKNMLNQSVSLQTSQKRGIKFPAGLHGSSKFGDLQAQQNNMIIKSKKAPSKQLSSFLLGLTNKPAKESEPKLSQQLQLQKDQLSRTSPEKKNTYGQAIQQISRLRKQQRRKVNFQYYSQEKGGDHEFPKLERKSSEVQKKKTNNITPSFNKNDSPLYLRSQCEAKQFELSREKQWKISSSPNKNSLNRLSVKLFKANEEPVFKKGYLVYEQDSKEFLQQNCLNIQEKAKISKKIPGITASNYIVIDRYSLATIAQKKSDQQIQIASLTKIMTCFLCILACKKYSVNLDTFIVRVTDRAAEMPGTSAQLQAGDLISLNNLLYGLMLPSGNDASVAIGEGVGKIIQRYKYKQSKKTNYQTFIYQMNMLAKQIGIQQEFQNTSGLSLNPNFSSPKALSVLTAIAMRNEKFVQIVNCKEKEIEIKNERFGLTRKQQWRNTNKLLWKQGWKGVKTGTTQTAGHCLMSCRQHLLISVYSCETLGKRFSECNKIFEFLRNEL